MKLVLYISVIAVFLVSQREVVGRDFMLYSTELPNGKRCSLRVSSQEVRDQPNQNVQFPLSLPLSDYIEKAYSFLRKVDADKMYIESLRIMTVPLVSGVDTYVIVGLRSEDGSSGGLWLFREDLKLLDFCVSNVELLR